mmetsp:Transcript_53728/g.106883  ORF Transcript_53728/g.106883 Transcript_53728/m.106883 type:complete len:239 (+) Transcript_53728:302-1018(+)
MVIRAVQCNDHCLHTGSCSPVCVYSARPRPAGDLRHKQQRSLPHAIEGMRASTSSMSLRSLAAVYRSSLNRCLLMWKACSLPSLSAHCIVSCGRKTRCSELVEMVTSRRQRRESRVGSDAPFDPWPAALSDRPCSTVCRSGSTKGACTLQSASSAASALGFRLLRMHVRTSQWTPVNSAPRVALSSDKLRCSRLEASAASGRSIISARTASRIGSMLSSVGIVRNAIRSSYGISSPRK